MKGSLISKQINQAATFFSVVPWRLAASGGVAHAGIKRSIGRPEFWGAI